YTVTGEVRYERSQPIYVALVRQEQFPFTNLNTPYQIFLPKPDTSQGEKRFVFQFSGLQAGEYAIVAFQDKNGNGILDLGLFGPTEPWDMSFVTNRPRFRAPRFRDASFRVPEGNRYFILTLE
ncbi:MAG: DUF2141 domain-containing protein, partial [Spirochaetales bacterium]